MCACEQICIDGVASVTSFFLIISVVRMRINIILFGIKARAPSRSFTPSFFLLLHHSLFISVKEERCKNVLARAILGARRSPFSRYHGASSRCDPTRCNAIQRDAMRDVIRFLLHHRSQQLTYKSSRCAPVINNSLPGNIQLL